MPGLILASASARYPWIVLDCARADWLVVLLAPVEVDLDHLAQGLGRRTSVPARHDLGLEPGLDALGLLVAALDLAADLPLATRHRIDAGVDDHLEAVAAGTDHRLASRSVNDESALSLTEPLTEGKRKVL
jgi:hypothetical protein